MSRRGTAFGRRSRGEGHAGTPIASERETQRVQRSLNCLDGLLVTSDRNQLGNRAARGPKLDGNDAGVTDDFAAIPVQLLRILFDVIHLDGEVMNAATVAC